MLNWELSFSNGLKAVRVYIDAIMDEKRIPGEIAPRIYTRKALAFTHNVREPWNTAGNFQLQTFKTQGSLIS